MTILPRHSLLNNLFILSDGNGDDGRHGGDAKKIIMIIIKIILIVIKINILLKIIIIGILTLLITKC